MTKKLKMLAFDFGASSGRAILGTLENNKLTLEEIHRFSNDPVEIRGSLYWDTIRLFHEIKQGILKCANQGHKDIDSIAIDTWGVDFGLLDENGDLIGNPYHYRDTRTVGMMEEVFKIIPADKLYSITGIQFMELNTIFQLYALRQKDSYILKNAKTLLLTPDLFNYFLTGVKLTEYSIASSSQLLDAEKRDWSKEILEKLGLPEQIFTNIVSSGTIVGTLSEEIAKELGVGRVKVIATAGHDTQCAIASVPSEENNFVYISCGTWSLMGVENDKPIINEKSDELAFTNEGGVENKITFLKNIMGLWLVQESKRQWDREGDSVSFAELEKLAEAAQPFKAFIDPDDKTFITPGNMPNKIRDYCKRTGQNIPETKGDIVRCIAQSLAMKYRWTVESLEEILGKKLSTIHMLGGGIKDKMLCQFTANATLRKVIAGPVEATSIGNIMIQAKALEQVKSLKEIRKIVKDSFTTNVYEPEDNKAWTDGYKRYHEIVKIKK
jgi:rhamnulokinase